mmetsp:Transcript_6233/g.27016  ORF Transcript_6233/g.27016 Transcript_6233/m.27016 type:complete len:205 (-) Transcript_6233:4262-4876(-)
MPGCTRNPGTTSHERIRRTHWPVEHTLRLDLDLNSTCRRGYNQDTTHVFLPFFPFFREEPALYLFDEGLAGSCGEYTPPTVEPRCSSKSNSSAGSPSSPSSRSGSMSASSRLRLSLSHLSSLRCSDSSKFLRRLSHRFGVLVLDLGAAFSFPDSPKRESESASPSSRAEYASSVLVGSSSSPYISSSKSSSICSSGVLGGAFFF